MCSQSIPVQPDNRSRAFKTIFGFTAAFALFAALSLPAAAASPVAFTVSVAKGLRESAEAGRLFVVLSRTNNPEPRLQLGRSGPTAPYGFAKDVTFKGGATIVIDHTAYGFPLAHLDNLPPGSYFAQAVFDSNADLRSTRSPGNLYSEPLKVKIAPNSGNSFTLELNHQIPAEQLPPNGEYVRFVKIQSKLLSQFHGRPIFLRAGIILPRTYDEDTARRYPVWVRVGGLNARYTVANTLMESKHSFRKMWLAKDTPQFIVVTLDGAGPLGDPYQVNSANNGPYGDAITQELIPAVESQFRALGKPVSRVLSGTSTGGWAALALQVFYPDYFNGVWSSCPDPVDFRALELANIYEEPNLYVNRFGNDRPSERTAQGDTLLLARNEVGLENLLGAGNSYVRSGEQWGAWTCVFSPRGADGLPVPLWNPQTGEINHAVAEQWKKYDLRLVLQNDWRRLAPKLRGKIHITAGEVDIYFLNNAVHLLDESLSRAEPAFEGSIIYGMGKGHGWSNLSLREMLEGMKAATEK